MKRLSFNLLLIGSIATSVMFTSCGADSINNTKENSTKNEVSEKNNDKDKNSYVGDEGTFTDSRDNKTYKWVKIGSQTWMAENLNYTGDNGFQKHIIDNNAWENNSDNNGWCYYDNDSKNGDIYGALYQWEAAKKACPNGWHLPTKKEWSKLSSYLKDNGYSYNEDNENRNIAKSLASNVSWVASDKEGAIGNSDFPEFCNKSGFSAIAGGGRDFSDGYFSHIGKDCSWWSATEEDERNVKGHSLKYNKSVVYSASLSKRNGSAVRCIKD